MKIKKRAWNLELKFSFSIKRVRRIEVPVPDRADDTHLRHGLHDGGVDQESWSATPDGEDKVVYYIGNTPHFIDIPKCKRSVQISCTPMRKGHGREYNTNRKVVIDLYY